MAGTLVANTINTDTGLFSTNNAYSGIAKAWVNYNGNSQTINGSFNVSSVTYSSTGQYVVNFTTTMGSTNFAVAVSTNKDNDTNDANIRITTGTNTTLVTTSTSVPITIFRGDGTAVNPTRVGVVVFSS